MTNLIKFKKTVLGWLNFTLPCGKKYNIDPETFISLTNVSEDARLGTLIVTNEDLNALKVKAIYFEEKNSTL